MTESLSADLDLRLAHMRTLPRILAVWSAIASLATARRLAATGLDSSIGTDFVADILIGSSITFVIFAIVDRVPFDQYGWRSVIVTLPLLVVVSLLHLWLLAMAAAFTAARQQPIMPIFRGFLLTRADRVLVDCAILWAIAHAIRLLRLRRITAMRAEHLSKRLAVAELENLSAQLQPHFLFNALNSIAALVGEDAQRARTMIARLSELLRQSLHSMHEREVPLADEVQTIVHYVELQRVRFEELMSFHADVPVECLNAAVPPLLLQPLVENAVKHGVATTQGVCRIQLRARRHFDELQLDVENDCGAMPPTVVEGVGLSNSRARLQAMYGDYAALRFERRESGAILVSIRIPFKTQRRAMTTNGELVLA
ncbi:MAG TPA: histidine kinase [Thermoanaerobaculia bacterium]|nr:histidine kinase [Thermoanaerobaculia bacterium]